MLNEYTLSLLIMTVLPVGWLATGSPARGQGLEPWGSSQEVTASAKFTTAEGGEPALLLITANIKKGWHIYSMMQPPPLKPTKINLDKSDAYEVVGSFRVSPAPDKKPDPYSKTLETHHGVVTWFAPIKLTVDDPANLRITGKLQVFPCDANMCLGEREISFTAKLGRGIPPAESVPAEAPPVPSPKEPPSTAVTQPEPGAVAEPTPSGAPEPSAAPVVPPAEHAAGGEHELPWQPFSMAGFRHVIGPDFDPETTKKNVLAQLEQRSIWWQVTLGFFGGLLLNLMPCVLPVIGLKILSFVEQSGHHRWQALLLNIWYSLGLISVFLVLATLAVFLNLGWGHLFKFPAFNIVMAAVVFSMGLSFLGVWEIPIPGFVGSGKAAELGQKEGFIGAFAKGVITTILATPCTGPFMAASIAWAVNQTPETTYAVFFSVGLGMASPYLLIGAFPALIRFLPKPGAWMETFKQLMGFVLLGTVVFIFTFLQLQYIVPTLGLLFALWGAFWWINRAPPTADRSAKVRAWLEAAIFVAVIWVVMFPGIKGLVPGRKFSFGGLYGVMDHRLERKMKVYHQQLKSQGWEYTGRNVMTGPSGGQTVLVDCTADWCTTCKTLEAMVLNTDPVRELVVKNRIVTLQADWTDEQPEVTDMLDILANRGVPTVAIFPAGDPNNPTVFRGAYTQKDLLDALEKAGPSRR